VAKSLRELETLRNEKWHVDFITGCIDEFEKIGFDTYTCIERINNAKLSKQWGTVTKFEHFIDEDDKGYILDSELIELKAKMLLSEGGFCDMATYQNLIQYWDKVQNPKTEVVQDGNDKLMMQINGKIKMRELFDSNYKILIEDIYKIGLITNPELEKVLGEYKTHFEKGIEFFNL